MDTRVIDVDRRAVEALEFMLVIRAFEEKSPVLQVARKSPMCRVSFSHWSCGYVSAWPNAHLARLETVLAAVLQTTELQPIQVPA